MNGEITYTFSRALHLMRYGGKKMRPLNMVDGRWYYVEKNQLYTGQVYEMTMPKFPIKNTMSHSEIMGSWVEVE